MRKLLVSLILVLIVNVIFFGCSKDSKSEYQGSIPTYPQASLVNHSESEIEFLVSKLSLSSFKNFYKNRMLSLGWILVSEGPNYLKYEKDDKEVIIHITSYESKYNRPKGEVLVNTTNAIVHSNQPVLITYIFPEKK